MGGEDSTLAWTLDSLAASALSDSAFAEALDCRLVQYSSTSISSYFCGGVFQRE